MPEDSYVTNAAWLRTAGRVDLVDEVADQFERPAEAGWPRSRADFWAGVVRWPRSAPRSAPRLHPHSTEAGVRAS
jgi:hypothetical protein